MMLLSVLVVLGCERENSTSTETNPAYDKLIKSANVSIMGQDFMEYEFRYDTKGRLASMNLQINDPYYDSPIHMNCTYEYSESKVAVTVVGDDAYGGLNNDYVAEYLFDADGIAYSCKREGYVATQMLHLGTQESYIYENGYIERKYVTGINDNRTSFSVEYDWHSGNLQKIICEPGDESDFVYTYTYDNRIDKSNLDLVKLMYYLNLYRGGHYTADKSVFKGMSSQNLVKTYKGESEVLEFDYKLDAEGYVLEVIVKMGGSPFMILSLKYK